MNKNILLSTAVLALLVVSTSDLHAKHNGHQGQERQQHQRVDGKPPVDADKQRINNQQRIDNRQRRGTKQDTDVEVAEEVAAVPEKTQQKGLRGAVTGAIGGFFN